MGNNPFLKNDPLGDTTIVNKYGDVIKQYGNDKSVFLQKGKKLESIGQIGGKIKGDVIIKNLLNRNGEIAKKLSLGSWANMVKKDGAWDLKNNTKTIFGVAWAADHANEKLGDLNSKTTFSYGNQNMNAADVGNFNAGYTGTYANIGIGLQWLGAGVVEMNKNGEYGKMFSMSTYNSPPYGDAVMDFMYNTQGMIQARSEMKAIESKTGIPSEFTGGQLSNSMKYGNW
jgi:hypothetical protein